MDPVRCGQLGFCADDRNPGAHLLQCAGRGRRCEQGELSGLLGLCMLGGHGDHRRAGANPGHPGRYQRLQKAHLHALPVRGCAGLLCHGRGPHLAAVPGHLHRGQDRLFGQSGVLRLHAGRRDHPRADGHGVLPRLCLGLHRQLCALCGVSGAGAGQRGHRHEPDDRPDHCTVHHGGVVAGHHPAAAPALPAGQLCGGGAARHPAEFCAHRPHPEAPL